MTENEERQWGEGYRAALTSTLQNVIRDLGYENATKESWILEREAALRVLRRICENHGDNDWGEDLHLADILDKHLERYLD